MHVIQFASPTIALYHIYYYDCYNCEGYSISETKNSESKSGEIFGEICFRRQCCCVLQKHLSATLQQKAAEGHHELNSNFC